VEDPRKTLWCGREVVCVISTPVYYVTPEVLKEVNVQIFYRMFGPFVLSGPKKGGQRTLGSQGGPSRVRIGPRPQNADIILNFYPAIFPVE
jgi:hypothetical protein